MGQKIHPVGFRLPVTRNWASRWYASNQNFAGMLAEDLKVREFLKDVSKEQIERVLAWAYLHETRSSYEIEGERPPGNKTEAFAALLRKASERRTLDEARLVELQNAAVTSPLARETSFRTTQNYLTDGAPGARGRARRAAPRPPAALPPAAGKVERSDRGGPGTDGLPQFPKEPAGGLPAGGRREDRVEHQPVCGFGLEGREIGDLHSFPGPGDGTAEQGKEVAAMIGHKLLSP